jgi:hypothetical protein
MRAEVLRLSELDVQRAVWDLLVQCDCKAYWLTQARPTKQTKGFPDLVAFHRLRGFAFIECKAPNGKPTREQRDFQAWCDLTGTRYILAATVEPVRDWLGAQR